MAVEVLKRLNGVASRAIGLVRHALSLIRKEAEQGILRYQAPPVFEVIPGIPRFCNARNQ